MGRLRKVLLSATTYSNNARSFVNETAKDLHIRKLDMSVRNTSTMVAGDSATASLDEVPVIQAGTNDSRSHIGHVSMQVEEGSEATAHFGVNGNSRLVLTFQRTQMVLEPDEGIFWNTESSGGDPTALMNCNVWYED